MFAWFERWFPKRWWVCNDNGLYVTKAWCAPPECTYMAYIAGGYDTEQEAVQACDVLMADIESRKVKHD
jgi:hypothetical protein